jgi:hypothetical protein
MIKLRIPFLLQCLVFLIPVNIYVLSNGNGYGVQWALFRYQQNCLGNLVYPVTNDLNAELSWGFQSWSAFAVILWVIAMALLIGCFVIHLLELQKQKSKFLKNIAIITIISGLIFALSDVVQYGLLFNSSKGFCIPIGIPLIIGLGWWVYRYEDTAEPLKLGRPEIIRSRILNELILIIFVSIFVKLIVFSISMDSPLVWGHADINLYYSYANNAISGKIPYIDYMIEYPQFFLIPVLIAAIPSFIIQSSSVYSDSFMILMNIVDIATLTCVYFIAIKLFGQEKALLCGLLYATAFSTAFLVSLTYDSVPSFFLIFSILLFLYGKEIPAYVSASVGTLTKWFPVFSFPYFILYTIKNKKETRSLKKGILISFVIIFLSVIPFILLDYQDFLRTYMFHFDRPAQTHSLVYFLDVISKSIINIEPFASLSIVFLVCGEVILIFWYYKYLNGNQLTLCYIVFLSVFLFVLLNKVFAAYYSIWVTPFLALFFINSYRQIVLFYLLQLVIYLEEPFLYPRVSPLTYSLFENSLPSFEIVFYSILFVIYFVVLYVIILDLRKTQQIEKIVKSG